MLDRRGYLKEEHGDGGSCAAVFRIPLPKHIPLNHSVRRDVHGIGNILTA